MENYTTNTFEQEGNVIHFSGILNVSYAYRVFELFQEKTSQQVILPKVNGVKKFKQSTEFGVITCNFERIPGYVPFKDFVGTISEKDLEFNITQQKDFVYEFEFIGTENKLNDILVKLKMSL